MNKLYILGALALSQVDAYYLGTASSSAVLTTQVGTYTYTLAADCFAALTTGTTNGMFNTYHQYYTFSIAYGTSAYAASSATSPAIQTYGYNGCYHQHLYNWMGQPAMATQTIASGFGNAVQAYGYTMTGSSLATCTATAPTIGAATGTLVNLLKTAFTGAQYQNVGIILTPKANLAAGSIATNQILVQAGPTLTGTSAGIIAAWSATIDGIVVSGTMNSYWDFMQSNVFQGQTLYGRGGGGTTSPCGWYVFYALEAPTPFAATSTTYNVVTNNVNAVITTAAVSVNMWTDNAVIKAASAFALTAVAGLLF